MNLVKYESQRNGLNSQLRKVLDATPIGEPWSATAVSAEMRRLGSGGADSRATLGCLSNLVEQGLVCEPKKGYFQRVQVKEKQPIKDQLFIEIENTSKEPEVQSKPVTTQMTAPSISPIEKLSKLASRLRDLANDMELAALDLAEQAEKNEAETAKMRQLQALLKSLG